MGKLYKEITCPNCGNEVTAESVRYRQKCEFCRRYFGVRVTKKKGKTIWDVQPIEFSETRQQLLDRRRKIGRQIVRETTEEEAYIGQTVYLIIADGTDYIETTVEEKEEENGTFYYGLSCSADWHTIGDFVFTEVRARARTWANIDREPKDEDWF